MSTHQTKAGRRDFLRKSAQALVTAPLAVAAVPVVAAADVNELADEPDPRPEDPENYRDPGPYGSLAD
jgi:hypothetical protein